MARWALLFGVALCFVSPARLAAEPLDGAIRSVVSVLPEWPPNRDRNEEPEGSGVVVLDGRTIVTAHHIVDRALSVRVRTFDGEIFDARVKGHDRATDLSVLTVSRVLRPIDVEEKDPELGEKVCAIGNAFGLGLSVTCGVVSGVHRAGVGFNRIEDFLQTDAAVNPGASGGALVNGEGELVGVLSAIFTKTSDANIGVNFAVSAPLAVAIAKDIRDKGRVKRSISGLGLAQAPAPGETGQLGARVVSVRPGSLAENAGLKSGDIILRAGGRRIRKPADFISAMSLIDRAGHLEVELTRGGETMTLRLIP